MTDRKQIRHYADQIATHLSEMEDLKVSIKGLLEAAKDEAIDTRALMKVAKELASESSKIQKMLDAEEQLDMFRSAVDLVKRKGLAAARVLESA